MKRRCGQVAVYLVAVIVAIAMLVIMNASVFLAVRSKNRAMNAGDAAALAVARYQGELLNNIGEDNIKHLKAAIKGDKKLCAEIMNRQMRRCFLYPIDGISIGNEAARKNAVNEDGGECKLKMLRKHVRDVRMIFANNTELFPEPWEGAWLEYAKRLEAAIGSGFGGLLVGPDNVEIANAWEDFPLLVKAFYNAIAGCDWCWFHFNGDWLFDRDSHNMPRPNYANRQPHYNCEVYSLHLDFRALPSLKDPDVRKIIMRLTGCSEKELKEAKLLDDPDQKWAFYDSLWRRWWEINPMDDPGFPVVGKVRPEYDIHGCAAVCRVRNGFQDLVDNRQGSSTWVAAAKPFGTETDLDGMLSTVTALKNFVTPAFSDAKLVPTDSVYGGNLCTADDEWMEHVNDHLPLYFENGPYLIGLNCYYCNQLRKWERPEFRKTGKMWLKYNSKSCRRSCCSDGGCGRAGGAKYAH